MMSMSASETSISWLESALIQATRAESLLLSPSSVRTGATGSDELQGTATRSLAGSIDARAPQLEQIADGAPTTTRETIDNSQVRNGSPAKPNLSAALSGIRTPETRRQHDQQQHFTLTPPALNHIQLEISPSFASDASWSEFSSPLASKIRSSLSPGQLNFNLPSSPSRGRASESEAMAPMALTQSQETKALEKSVTRSQSDFSRWLEDAILLARGDDASTTESEEIVSSIAGMTQQTRTGTNYAQSEPQTIFSGFESSPGIDGEALRRELDSLVLERETLWASERVSSVLVKSDLQETEKIERVIENSEHKIPSPVNTIELLEAAPVAVTVEKSDRGNVWNVWKAATILLVSTWLATKARPRFVPILLKIVRNLTEQYDEYTSPTLLSNQTLPVSVAYRTEFSSEPIKLGPSVTLPILATLLAIAMTVSYRLTTHKQQVPTRSRESSPLLEMNAPDLIQAKILLPVAISEYHVNEFPAAIKKLNEILLLGCGTQLKSTAANWLGRCLYRIARFERDETKMKFASQTFFRAIRLDPQNATARANLGKCQFRLGMFSDAVKSLTAAVKRDNELSYAHEFLAKSLLATENTNEIWEKARVHLKLAIEIDANNYTALAFLGESLHLRGENLSEAKFYLNQAISVRNDFPAVHARLAFDATQKMDKTTAAKHLQAVIETRETGFKDEDLNLNTNQSILESFPFLSLYFALDYKSIEPSRLDVLQRAIKLYPNENLIQVLLACTRFKSDSESLGAKTDLKNLEAIYEKRSLRFGAEDTEGLGLWAIVLLAQQFTSTLSTPKTIPTEESRSKPNTRSRKRADGTKILSVPTDLKPVVEHLKAEEVYQKFWTSLSQGKGSRSTEAERNLAFIVMAIYEFKRS